MLGACEAPRTCRKYHEVSFLQKALESSLTLPAELLSNLVSEMVIVTVPPSPPAVMAPPYKVDVPPPDVEHRESRLREFSEREKNGSSKYLFTLAGSKVQSK